MAWRRGSPGHIGARRILLWAGRGERSARHRIASRVALTCRVLVGWGRVTSRHTANSRARTCAVRSSRESITQMSVVAMVACRGCMRYGVVLLVGCTVRVGRGETSRETAINGARRTYVPRRTARAAARHRREMSRPTASHTHTKRHRPTSTTAASVHRALQKAFWAASACGATKIRPAAAAA